MLDIKKLLTKALTSVYNLIDRQMSEQLANTSVMTWTAGSAHGVKLPNGDYIVAFSYGIKTTANRTDLAAFRILAPNGHALQAKNPYFIPCAVNGAFRWSYGNMVNGWFTAPGLWSANTEMRVSAVCIMYDLGY